MYHEFSEKRRRQSILKRILALLIVVLIVLGSWFAFNHMNESLRTQSALAIRMAVLNSAQQCAAIEGSYPSSLKYLEDNYGLIINHDKYTVIYDAFASNVMPTVVVIPK
ncbi:MAG: hypothetical protein FWE65_02420 [Eggerthellaceae bacterium]|nr:hypothetical protein [Eggerthellaceae bacterium]